MRVQKLFISNFRGVREGVVDFSGHTLLVGGNNIGKSTVCEALDLVLGPERLSRRSVDEHDFYCGRYLDANGKPIDIQISAVLTELSTESERRFYKHLRRWNTLTATFADETGNTEASDGAGTCWVLPVLFIARYDADNDDFIANTFFENPLPAEAADVEAEAEQRLGEGRDKFTRDHKRLCGFLFLHALRTGSRALSLQRGSLLDTILRLPGNGLSAMWLDTLRRLRDMEPAIGEIEQLSQISDQIRQRMGQFVNLSPGDGSTAFFASDLTREHLREVVRLFLSVQPGEYLLPFQRLGTGSVNLLVFAMLTFIADLKDEQNVIFAMEEPELALPPHTQRRVTRFVLSKMGQGIVTSHSPYVIEQFDPSQIVVLNRSDDGQLVGKPIDLHGIKPRVFAKERHQFAEAVLARAVLVVEGGTECAVFAAASSVMEQYAGSTAYTHFDIAGVSLFDAGGDGLAPAYGPFFKALGKPAFCVLDKPKKSLSDENTAKLADFAASWISSEHGIESLLTKELNESVLRRFLDVVKSRADYPQVEGMKDNMSEEEIRVLTRRVLEARKGNLYGYAAMLIGECHSTDELPQTVRRVLEEVHKALTPALEMEPAAPEPVVSVTAEGKEAADI